MSATTELTVITHGDLSALPAQIDAAIADVHTHAHGMVHAAVRAGQLLIEAKAAVPHGQFEDWIKANCSVAPRTAQAYMRLAKGLQELDAPKAQRVADLPLREALKAITTSPTAPQRESNPRLQVAGREDRDRFVTAMQKSAAAMRGVARLADVNFAKRTDIDKARAKLQAAIDLLDQFQAQAEVQS